MTVLWTIRPWYVDYIEISRATSDLIISWDLLIRLEESRKHFGPVKPFFSSSVSKNGEVYNPETSCTTRTSDRVSIWEFCSGFPRAESFRGLQETGH